VVCGTETVHDKVLFGKHLSNNPSFHQTPYIMSGSGITTSRTVNQQLTKDMMQGRVIPNQSLYMRAWHRWSQAPHQWPNITRALSNNGSAPSVERQVDFGGCNHHTWHYGSVTLSAPVFTTCAHVNCQYAWPQPTYQTIHDARLPEEWNAHFLAQAKESPWKSKRKQVVWRGDLTGRINKELDTNVRWAAARLAHTIASPYWDIGLYTVPPGSPREAECNLSEVGGLKKLFASIVI
jgi:hypothetical protein